MKHPIIGAMLLSILVLFSACKDDEPDPVAEANFTVTIENVTMPKDYSVSGVFNTPVGETSPGPAFPGSSYEFSFNAGKGSYLSFATMFVQSNDLFFAPNPLGIKLYNSNGDPVTGNVTTLIDLWDAGTEVNQEPGVGDDQAPRQSGPNVGASESNPVMLIADVNDGFTYPGKADIIKVSLAHDGGTLFTVTLENVSGSSSVPGPLAPGAFVVHASGKPLFTEGMDDYGDGLEGVAEDGSAGPLGDALAAKTGLVSPLSPGAYAVHEKGANPIFTSGQADLGEGLEGIAEDGAPGPLNTALTAKTTVFSNGVFNTPTGASAPGPLLPGNTYTFTFTATDGDYLNFATMFVQSNDLFYAFSNGGLALFNGGVPVTGDMTSSLSLYDAGTEVNEFPGAGNNQVIRQAAANTGPTESGVVAPVNDGFTYPANGDVIKVTITKN